MAANARNLAAAMPPGTYTVEGICAEKDGPEEKKTKKLVLCAGATAMVNFIWP